MISLGSMASSLEHTVALNPWIAGGNITGLSQDSTSVSYAQVGYSSEDGNFRNFSDAESLWSIGAKAEGISHKGKISMMGAFEYSHAAFSDMCGSMFISSGSYPFDLIEFTPGDKTLQSYYLMGGITSTEIKGWKVGFKTDFKAQNYAKSKDLRHYNYRMEMNLNPSVSYRICKYTLGANYTFKRNSETVRAQQIGSSTAGYYVMLDKGLLSGAYQNWQGTGVHLNESGVDGFPVRENTHGLALQVQRGGFYAQVEYLYSEGEVGEKTTYWFEFPSENFALDVAYKTNKKGNIHLYNLKANYNLLSNYENVLTTQTSSGVSTTVVSAQTKILSSSKYTLEPSFRIITAKGADYTTGASLSRELTVCSQMYPYVDEQITDTYQIYFSALIPIKAWEIKASLSLGSGYYNKDSYSIGDNVNAGDKPTFLEDYYTWKYDYLTASYAQFGLGVRYNLPIKLFCEMGAYITQKLTSAENRWGANIIVGYNF